MSWPRRRRPAPEPGELGLRGWPPGERRSAVDELSDGDLEQLNRLLPWSCFTTDSHGRRFGDRAWIGKRDTPESLPDPRIIRMDRHFGLSGATVLEVGCFEGVHTIALCDRARSVVAVDSRIENVVKTAVRAALYGVHPQLFLRDADQEGSLSGLDADLVHHVGVLYHLANPVAHLIEIGAVVRRGMMLDTHIALEGDASEELEVAGESFAYRRVAEGGRAEVFSGMADHAKWLTLEGLLRALRLAGFPTTEIVEERAERNGPRVLLFAER